MSKTKALKKKIIWLVDPFEKNKESQLIRCSALAIQNLFKESPCIIEPVYFFNSSFQGECPTKIPKSWVTNTQEEGQKKLIKIVKPILKSVETLHVIAEPCSSMRDQVNRIRQIAKRWKADLVVCSTHARTGLKRWALGSFAETLLLYADVPLLFVNPLWNAKNWTKQILFATDFSDESKQAYQKVIQIASEYSYKIHLFHRLMIDFPPVPKMTRGEMPFYTQAFEQELEARTKNILEWKEEAKLKGVKIDAHIDYQSKQSISQSILTQAKKIKGLIAMASRSGFVKTMFLGSTTRKIVRNSPFPVWVLHPQGPLQKNRKLNPITHQRTSKKNDPVFSLTPHDIEEDLERMPHR